MDSSGVNSLEITDIIRGGYTDALGLGVHFWLDRRASSSPLFRLMGAESLKVSWPPGDDEGS